MYIEFIASSTETENFVKSPQKSILSIPKWFTSQRSEYAKSPQFDERGKAQFVNGGIRACMPFFDSLTHGYIQETWCDIYIEKDKTSGQLKYYYSSSPEIMASRAVLSTTHHDGEYYPNEFTWHIEWINKTPKGYSVLITHPLNRLDLPFTTMSAIIDSDLYHHSPSGNLPFLIKNNFEGLIPAGTPMYQVIPIKRESWTRKQISYGIDVEKRWRKQQSKFSDFYKKHFWQKKRFD